MPCEFDIFGQVLDMLRSHMHGMGLETCVGHVCGFAPCHYKLQKTSIFVKIRVSKIHIRVWLISRMMGTEAHTDTQNTNKKRTKDKSQIGKHNDMFICLHMSVRFPKGLV